MATVFLLEMWERMSFYGMRALLILYLVDATAGLGLDDHTAASIYGLYVGGTYIACLPGGWLGDRLLGAQRAVLLGGIVIVCGHLLLGLAHTASAFFGGLLVIVLGTGLLKPNASTLVALLYPEGGARRDAGFTIYYVGVNLGAAVGPLIAGALALHDGWGVGFLSAAAGMSLGVTQFLWGRRFLAGAGRASAAGRPTATVVRGSLVGGALLALLVTLFAAGIVHVAPDSLAASCTWLVLAAAITYFLYLLWGAGLTDTERRRVRVVIVLFIASVLFWSGFEQAGSSLNLFALRYTDRHWGSFEVPAAWLQSLNAVFIIVFGSLFSGLWLALGRRGLNPSTGIKFTLGLAGVALGFAVMAAASRLVVGGHRVGMGWLTATYLLHTWAELCLSPVGLSAVTKLVPTRFVGQSLGIFFVSLSLGNLLASRIAGGFDPTQVAAMPGQFMFIFRYCALCAVGLALLLPLLRRWSVGVT
jgi:POT family proton-dependent oligopeptide transporter